MARLSIGRHYDIKYNCSYLAIIKSDVLIFNLQSPLQLYPRTTNRTSAAIRIRYVIPAALLVIPLRPKHGILLFFYYHRRQWSSQPRQTRMLCVVVAHLIMFFRPDSRSSAAIEHRGNNKRRRQIE